MSDETVITCENCGASRDHLSVDSEFDHLGERLFIKCDICRHRTYKHEKPKVEIDIKHVKHTDHIEICTGCNENEIYTNINKLGLCIACGKKLKSWRASKKTLPVPFVKHGGKWQPNPERNAKVEIVLTGQALCSVSHRLTVNKTELAAILKDPALISKKLEHHVGAYDVESWSGLEAVVQGWLVNLREGICLKLQQKDWPIKSCRKRNFYRCIARL